MKKFVNLVRMIFVLVVLLVATHSIQAQYHYTPPPPTFHPPADNTWRQHMFSNVPYRNYYGTVSQKHKFRIVFSDGRDTIVSTRIIADSPAYYIVIENKSVPKRDSARHQKVYPFQTKYIARTDMTDSAGDYIGMATDSCWLFGTIKGPINAYTPLAEDDIDDDFLWYVQKSEGPFLKVSEENVEGVVADNEKALKLARKKKFTKAISKYNKVRP